MAKSLNEQFATAQVTVATTAGGTLISAARPGGDTVTIQNLGTTAVYVGVSGVTTSTGFPIPGVAGASLTLPANVAIYGIVASGTQAVAVLATF
jgi:hypothetical protein